MIRNTMLAACLATQGAAQPAPAMTDADCNASYEVTATSSFVPVTYETAPEATEDGWCQLGGLILETAENVTIEIDTLRWRVAGHERLAALLPPTALAVKVNGLRYAPRINDPVMDYLLSVQSVSRGIDASINVYWDADQKSVELTEAHAEFGYGNQVSMSAQLTNVDLTDMASLQLSAGSMALTQLETSVSTDWLFEGYVAMPVGIALLDGAGDPEAEVERLKAMAVAAVDTIPERIIDEESADAIRRLINDLPHPRGRVETSLRSETGIGMTIFGAMAARGAPDSFEEVWSYLPDLTLSATYVEGPVAP